MIQRGGAALLTIAALGLPANAASGQNDVPAGAEPTESRDNQQRYIEHRRRIEEDTRSSRAMQPPPRPTGQHPNGIVLLPVDLAERSGFSKDWTEASVSEREERTRREIDPRVGPRPWMPPPPPCFGGPRTGSALRVFPEVTWHVCFRDTGRKGLWVGPVHLRRTSAGPWMTVLYEAGLAEIFVPYHHNNFRPYDLQWTLGLSQVGPQDAGLNGSLVWLSGETVPTVVTEVRDRGIGWLCKGDTAPTRRAQELVVWGIVDGGNYDNIIEFGFRDDGAMTFRMGNTGYNSPANPVEPHTHNALWRVDMDLNGPGGDTAYWMTHNEPTNPPFARDDETAFGTEGARQWSTTGRAGLIIEDNAVNAFGNRIGYQFVPTENMNSRHYEPGEQWTQNDVYVTRYSGSELSWMGPYPYPNAPWTSPDGHLLTFLNGQSTNSADLVAWIKTAAEHHPTDEDRSHADLNAGTMTGVTLAHWSGFRAEPFNLFNANPLGGPSRCGQ